MKNQNWKSIKLNIFSFKKNLTAVLVGWLNSLNRDFSFYNKHTEMLAIWTVLFLAITGLFILALKSSILTVFLLILLAIIIIFASTLGTIFYLHALKYHNQKKLLPRIHNFLNKSFKLRLIFHFIKIPHLPILSNIVKSLKPASWV